MAKVVKRREFSVLESKTVLRGRVFSVSHDRVREPGGVEVSRDVVRHAGSAVILPRRDDGRILLVRQFRLPVRDFLWELCAGRLDKGEAPLEAARRELEEETGLTAERWKLLVEYFPTPGYVDEKMWVFLAEGLKRGRARPEEDECIERKWFTPEQVLRMIRTGKLQDGKALVGCLLLALGEAADQDPPQGHKAHKGH
jgi:ADP-ribose pyrophosphatase